MANDKNYVVYLYKDKKTNAPLYIGCTSNQKSRDKRHSTSSVWYEKSSGMVIMRVFNTQYEAENMEGFLIRKLNPIYNIHKKHSQKTGERCKEKRIKFEERRKQQIEDIKLWILNTDEKIKQQQSELNIYNKMLAQILDDKTLMFDFDSN